MGGLPTVAHVPMALAVQGGTLMTVVARTTAAYASLGGTSIAVLSDNRDVSVDGVENLYVDYTRNCPREWFTRRELAVDVLSGRLGRLRPHYGRMYDPAIEALEDVKPDVVLLYEGHYASATLPRWKRAQIGAELCLYVHNPLSRSYGRRELRRLLAPCDRVAFCSSNLRHDVVQRLGYDDERFAVVPNAVDRAFFGPNRTEPPEDITVVYVGRIGRDKGVGVLFDAVEMLALAVGRPIHLRVVGSSVHGGSAPSDFETRLRDRTRTMAANVEFLGWQPADAVARELVQATVAVVPSLLPEGFSMAVLEAMASGTPVAASDSPGVMEALGGCGRVSRRGDARGLADDLAALVTDPEAWMQASALGRERAARFSWERTARALAAG